MLVKSLSMKIHEKIFELNKNIEKSNGVIYFICSDGYKKGAEKMKKRILIVDDNPAIIFSVKNGLEEEYDDFDVVGAEGGQKCFDFLSKEERPDLILLDIMMPDINGWDVYAMLQEKEDWKNIPIVFLTAKTDGYSKGFGKLAVEDYIEKPFNIEDLKNRINAVLKKRENIEA